MSSSRTLKDTFFAALTTVQDYVALDGSLLQGAIAQDAEQLAPRLLDLVFGYDQLRAAFTVTHGPHLVLDKAKLLTFLTSKDFLPDSFTAFSNKIGLTSEGRYISYNRDVVLDFPYKDAVLVGNQSREEQEGVSEKFYNEVLAADEIDRLFEPKAFAGFLRHTPAGAAPMTVEDSVSVDEDNLVVQGNNLLVLHSLRARYAGQVKLIYIDVPYNTGSDSFAYNDKFNHSTWLTFMKNRLEAAKPLLSAEGVVVVQLDQNEHHYLKVLMDEVFGRANFINEITVRSSTPSGPKVAHASKTIIKTKDAILVYKKGPEVSVSPQYVLKEKWDEHYSLWLERDNKGGYTLSSLADVLKKHGLLGASEKLSAFDHTTSEARLFYVKNGEQIVRKTSHKNADALQYGLSNPGRVFELNENLYQDKQMIQPLSKGLKPVVVGKEVRIDLANLLCDIWTDIDFQNTQNEGGVSFPSGKKPEALLYRILAMFTQPGDRVLDFFLGSGTTAAVAHKMGRKYIGIEQMAYGENSAEVRLSKVIAGEQSGVSTLSTVAWAGGGSFVSMRLLGRTEEFTSRVMDATASTIDGVVADLSAYALYLDYRFRPEVLASPAFEDLSLEQKKTVLMRALDKSNLYVNYADVEDSGLAVSAADKALNHKFYGVK